MRTQLALVAALAAATPLAAQAQAAPPKSMYMVETSISAQPQAIWDVLTNGAAYTQWNPTIDKLEGKIEQGGHITVYPKGMGGKSFALTVTTWDPPRKMVWTGGMPLGLFKAERSFTLTATDEGRTIFNMREEFGGLMAGMILPSLPDLQPSFDEFAKALKQRTSLP